jgi:hypothetical protein
MTISKNKLIFLLQRNKLLLLAFSLGGGLILISNLLTKNCKVRGLYYKTFYGCNLQIFEIS